MGRDVPVNEFHMSRDYQKESLFQDVTDVCLVHMPYAVLSHPSLALGLLKACLTEAGLSASVIYAHLWFAEEIGFDVAKIMSVLAPVDRVGEWTFAGVAFPAYAPDATVLLRRVGQRFLSFSKCHTEHLHDAKGARDAILGIRALAPNFVDRLARAVLNKRPRVVACSSTFVQHTASLALLRRIRELAPEVVTLLGGSNCDSEMGVVTAREFPWVDVVFSGEADRAIVPLCRSFIERGRAALADALPEGAMTRARAEQLTVAGRVIDIVPRVVVNDLDANPPPDFSEYFGTLARMPFQDEIVPGLLSETARGCWHRRKGGCTFCGLNGHTFAYRSKSPARALAELDHLSRTYGIRRIEMTDNILNMAYFKTLIPQLGARANPYDLFYEIPAALSRAQVQALVRAGVHWVQPGIESLNDDCLTLMNKGTTAMGNLQLLKYLREFGVDTTWHLLVGFPQEQESWYIEMVKWLPLVYHLPPPTGLLAVSIQRFSAYHRHPGRYGLTLAPYRGYAESYPLASDALMDLAYMFEEKDPAARVMSGWVVSRGLLNAVVRQWRSTFFGPAPAGLLMEDAGDRMEIFDMRPCALQPRWVLEGLPAAILRACDPALSLDELKARMASDAGVRYPEAEVLAAVENLKEWQLLLELGGRYLNLAVAGDAPRADPGFPGGYVKLKKDCKVL